MARPALDAGDRVLDTFLPRVPPTFAHVFRVRRPGMHAEQRRADGEPVMQQAAAVILVRVAVVGRIHGHDRAQFGRVARRDLQAHVAGPREARHPDFARAPGLARDPRECLERILHELGRELVGREAVGIASAAAIDLHAGIAMAREVAVSGRIAHGLDVALAVDKEIHDRGHLLARGHFGQPEPCGEALAFVAGTRQRDPGIANLPHRIRELVQDLHALPRGREFSRRRRRLRRASPA